MKPAFAFALVLGLLSALPGWAQPGAAASRAASGTTNLPPYRVRVEHVGGPGLMPANFAYVNFGTNKFGFVMPEGFRLETENWERVTLVNADLSCLLTFRVIESFPPGTTELDADGCRRLVLDSHAGCKILQEFTLAGASQRGPAFDVQWNAARGVPRRERLLFVATNAGVLEFSLVGSPERFEQGHPAFNFLLTTFRTPQQNGRLVMPVMSDKL